MTGLPMKLTGCSVLPPRDEAGPDNRLNNGNQPVKPKDAAQNRKGFGDRFTILNAFTDFTLADLSRNEIAVWLVLYRDSRDGIARTSQADIARRIGVCERTVRRTLLKLQRRGLVEVVRRGGINRGPSMYRVLPRQRESAADRTLSAQTGQNDVSTSDT